MDDHFYFHFSKLNYTRNAKTASTEVMRRDKSSIFAKLFYTEKVIQIHATTMIDEIFIVKPIYVMKMTELNGKE